MHLIKVKGNFEDFVYTNRHFKGMIESFEQIRSIFNIKAFNLSNGAYLPGIKALSSKQVEILAVYNKNIERLKIMKSLQEILNKYFKLILPFYCYSKEINEKKSMKILEINFFNIVEFIKKRI